MQTAPMVCTNCFCNQPSQHVASIRNLTWAELRGNILVVLSGPFTKTQKALTMKKVNVDPKRVLKAYEWLIKNNLFYQDDRLPSIEDVPIPTIFNENV